MSRLRIGQPCIGPHEVSHLTIRAARTAADEDIEDLGPGVLHDADLVGAGHVGFDRPFMAFDRKHPVLFAVRADHMDTDRVTGMRLDQRRHRIFRLVHHAGLENLAQRAALLLTELIGFRAVVDRRQPGHVLHIGHERGADDIVLVLEEKGHVTVVPLADVLRQTGVDNDVSSPGILLRHIRTGHRIAILRPARTDHDGAVQSVARIHDDVATVPHQRRRFLVRRMCVIGISAALARGHRLIAGIVADVQALAVSRIEGQARRKE